MELDQAIHFGTQAVKVNRVQDLENRRNAITQLYWDEDRDLPEVMIIMETQYQFKATNRQYKSAFKRWGLQKHVSGADMRNLVRIRKRRHAMEKKPTKFFVNKRQVPVEKIERWIQRTGFEHRVEMSEVTLTGETPPNVEYQTPSDYQSIPNTPEDIRTPVAETIQDPSLDIQPWPVSLLHSNVENQNNLGTNTSFDSTFVSSWDARQWFSQPDATTTTAARPVTPAHDPELRQPFGFSLTPASPSASSSVEIVDEARRTDVFELTSGGSSAYRLSREKDDMQPARCIVPVESDPATQRRQALEEEVWINEVSSSVIDCCDSSTTMNVDATLDTASDDDTFIIIDKDDFERQIFIDYSQESFMEHNEETLGRQLRSAASRGDGPVIQKILATQRIHVDHCSTAGRTALHNAAFSGHVDIIITLVAAGADIFFRATKDLDNVDACSSTAVELAIDSNRSDSLQALLSASINLRGLIYNYQERMSEVIEYAMDNPQLNCLVVIVRHVESVGLFDWSGCAYHAVRRYRLHALQLFIAHKVYIEVSSTYGPILHAAIAAYRPSFPASLESIESLVGTVSLKTRDRQGREAIHLAASCACDEVLRLLLKNNVDPNTKAEDGRTPLHYLHEAIFQRRSPQRLANCIRILIDAGADLDARDKHGKTILHHAPVLAKWLVTAGSNLNAKDVQGKPPLYAAIRSGKAQDVRGLLSCSANPNQTVRGKPLLFAAISYRYPQIVRILIEGGADVNAKDNIGQTPLYHASQEGSHLEVEALLECGADPDICKSKGWPPILTAIKYDYQNIVRLLLEGGADANIKALGVTPLYVAKLSSSDPAILQMLLEHGARDDTPFKYPDWEKDLELALDGGDSS